MKDDGSVTWYDRSTDTWKTQKRDEGWFAKLSKWFAGALYLGGIEYASEEVASSATEAITGSAIATENPGSQPELSDSHVQVELHAIDSHEIIPVDTHVIVETNVDVVQSPRRGPAEVSLEPMTSTPDRATYERLGARPKSTSTRYPSQRTDIEYGTEDYVQPNKKGFLEKVRGTSDFISLRGQRGYNKFTNELDEISMIEMDPMNEMIDVNTFDGPWEDFVNSVQDNEPMFELTANTPPRLTFRRPQGYQNDFLDQWYKRLSGQKTRFVGRGIEVNEEGEWVNKGWAPAPNFQKGSRPRPRKRKAPQPGPRPQPGPKPGPVTRPGREVPFHFLDMEVKKKKCKRNRKGKCIKRK